jgi:peptidoglycan/xylan/chitin deacetylase (PgdA/CDA1 family)
MNGPVFLKKAWASNRLLAHIRHQPVTILLFHSVGREPEADFLPNTLNCAPDFFEEVLRLLQRHTTVLPLCGLADAIRAQKVPRNAVALTLDDGFRDNYTTAWPLLRQYKLPATFFLPTDAIGADELLPVHKYYYLANHKKFAFPKELALDLPERRRVINELCTGIRFTIPHIGGKLYLNWQQAEEMAESGMEIGAHTQSHPWIAAISTDEARKEITGSKQILEQRLGRPIKSFAYPYGFGYSVNPAAAEVVAQNFEVACLTTNVLASASDPWKLPRSNIAGFYVS